MAFSSMIFQHGFVHVDPHQGNLYIRKAKGSKNQAEVILLDHGFYKELDDETRLSYSKLWRGIITNNEKEIFEGAKLLGAGDQYKILSAMITSRSWEDISSNNGEM